MRLLSDGIQNRSSIIELQKYLKAQQEKLHFTQNGFMLLRYRRLNN